MAGLYFANLEESAAQADGWEHRWYHVDVLLLEVGGRRGRVVRNDAVERTWRWLDIGRIRRGGRQEVHRDGANLRRAHLVLCNCWRRGKQGGDQ
jgi:hypothetical protein